MARYQYTLHRSYLEFLQSDDAVRRLVDWARAVVKKRPALYAGMNEREFVRQIQAGLGISAQEEMQRWQLVGDEINLWPEGD